MFPSPNKQYCRYCGIEINSNTCEHCGAPNERSKNNRDIIERFEPFSWDGYIVWQERDWAKDTIRSNFYLGHDLIDVIEVNRDVLKDLPIGTDYMYFIWDLFKISQGEEEVLRIRDKNSIKPKVFEIRLMKTYEL